jgi:hypothetical protein
MFCGILFSRVISILIKILKRESPGLLRDHPSSGDLPIPIVRMQPTVIIELSFSLKILRPDLSENTQCFGPHIQYATQSKKSVSRQRISDNLRGSHKKEVWCEHEP